MISAQVSKIQLNVNTKIGINGQLASKKIYIPNSNNTAAIKIENNRIGYITDFEEAEINSGESIRYIDFNDGFTFKEGQTGYLNLTNNYAIFESDLKINKTVWYGELMEYRPVEENGILIGYDLYIK